jgi:hypothetical protein
MVSTPAKPSGFEPPDHDDMNPPSPISLVHAQVLDQIDMYFPPQQTENEPSIRATIPGGSVLDDTRSSIVDPYRPHPSPIAQPGTLSSCPPSAGSSRDALDTIHIKPFSKTRTDVDASISQGAHIPFPRPLSPRTSPIERSHSWTSLGHGMPKTKRIWEPIHMDVLPQNISMDV